MSTEKNKSSIGSIIARLSTGINFLPSDRKDTSQLYLNALADSSEAEKILKNPKLSVEQLVDIAIKHSNQVIINQVLLDKRLKPAQIYRLAISCEPAAAAIMIHPRFRSYITNSQWFNIVEANVQIAKIALSNYSWKIFTAENLESLVKTYPGLLSDALKRFSNDELLQKENWVELAATCGEQGLEIIKHPAIAREFSSQDFLDIARRNDFARTSIIQLHAKKLDMGDLDRILDLIPFQERQHILTKLQDTSSAQGISLPENFRKDDFELLALLQHPRKRDSSDTLSLPDRKTSSTPTSDQESSEQEINDSPDSSISSFSSSSR